MDAEIITIGDEILIGQIVDTNSAWMAQQLNLSGINVKQITSVSDQKQHIISALDQACTRADIILITGGLGPTRDDITKLTLCEYFNSPLIFNEEAFRNVERLFARLNLAVTGINRKQAEVPDKCMIIQNELGTAPGMWFEANAKIFVSMPGVPYEMKGMMQKSILPLLRDKFKRPFIVHKTILTQGIGESFLADKIKDWEESLATVNVKLAYLPSPGTVKLRLSTAGNDASELDRIIESKISELQNIIPSHIYGFEIYGEEIEGLENIVGKLLRTKNATLSIAESCTGGYISHLITSVPGASDYFAGAIVSYANKIKEEIIKVNPTDIENYGAVSEEVVKQMALNAKKILQTDYVIATTGIAGPGGGTIEKPVGTVWIALASPVKVVVKKFLFGNHRGRNIHKTAIAALNMLRMELIAE